MKIVFDKLQSDGQGSFYVCDDSNNKLFHFLTQVEDKNKLESSLIKYLKQVKKEKENEENKKKLILSIVDKVNFSEI